MEKYNRTLLYSGDTVSACDLSEPVTNFEFFEIDRNTRGCFFPATASLPRAKTTEVGYWQNDGYLDKQEVFKLTNNGQHLESVNFQYIQQTSSNNLRLLGSAINRANNIKFFTRVYGCNRIAGTSTASEGVPPSDSGYKQYEEVLLTTGDETWTKSAIQLSEPARGFERIKVLVGSYTESPNIYEYNAPLSSGENFTTHSYWGGDNSNFLNWARWEWKGDTSVLSAYNGGQGKSFQLGFASGASNSLTAVTGTIEDSNWVRRNIRKIWGINRRPTHSLTILSAEHGSAYAPIMSGFEHDMIEISPTPDADWYLSGYNVTGATMSGNKFTFGDQDVIIQPVFTDEAPVMLDYYPIGSYYTTKSTDFDPNVLWGGTWELDTSGKVTRGGTTVGATGGEITHATTVNELPAHNHTTNRYIERKEKGTNWGNDNLSTVKDCRYGSNTTGNVKQGDRTTTSCSNTSTSHNNVQKSLICRRWHRIA
jgi:hypothetical protein